MSTPFVPPALSFWASHLALSCATVNASRPVFGGDAFLLFAAGAVAAFASSPSNSSQSALVSFFHIRSLLLDKVFQSESLIRSRSSRIRRGTL